MKLDGDLGDIEHSGGCSRDRRADPDERASFTRGAQCQAKLNTTCAPLPTVEGITHL
jgi:hypothetical protein